MCVLCVVRHRNIVNSISVVPFQVIIMSNLDKAQELYTSVKKNPIKLVKNTWLTKLSKGWFNLRVCSFSLLVVCVLLLQYVP